MFLPMCSNSSQRKRPRATKFVVGDLGVHEVIIIYLFCFNFWHNQNNGRFREILDRYIPSTGEEIITRHVVNKIYHRNQRGKIAL